ADHTLWPLLAEQLERDDDPRRAELLRLHQGLLATCCQPDRHPERAEQHARLTALLAEGTRPCVPRRTVELGGGIRMAFHFIPPGTFLMGSPKGEKGRVPGEARHRVGVQEGFWLGVAPVTQEQWR